jgi:tripartite-type tricarboxylate transporter receptor subunit TctC
MYKPTTLLAAIVMAAVAQTVPAAWPDRPVKTVAPLLSGGGTGVVAHDQGHDPGARPPG